MSKILVVEDDRALNDLVCIYLKGQGYETVSCENGAVAFEKFTQEKFDLVITEIMMPVLDGFSLAQKIRAVNKIVPLLFMTAKEDATSQKLGFTLGGDDYIVKPFDTDIFLLRVSALLRRAQVSETKNISVGNLTMDEVEHTAYLNGEELPLTVREFDLLYKFLSYPKKTFTRSALMEEFWGFDTSASSRTVDVYMAKLREKTASCDGFEIVTVHGLGYKAVLK